MKIAIFSDNFYPELGGIQDSLASLGRELDQLGHQVIFYAAQPSLEDFAVAKLPTKEIYLGRNIKIKRFFSLPVPSPTRQSRLVIPTGLRWLGLKKFKPDLIHVHTFFGLGLEAIAASRMLKVPLIGTNHWVITEFNSYSPIAAKTFARLSLKLVIWYYNHCDFVSAPSRTVLTEMLQHGFHKPHQVVSNPIDLDMFKPLAEDKAILKKEFNLSNAAVAYVGRLGKEKNIDVLIRAMALAKVQAPEINLAIAGHGSAEAALKRLVHQLRLEENVKFVGTLDKAKLCRLYNAADIFAIASTSESQSMVLLQAMACGLPVIGVNWRALPEYINCRNGYMVEPDNYQAMAEKIIYLFKYKDVSKLLGQGGLAYVQQFSALNIAKEWEKLYRRVIEDYKTIA